MSVEYPGMTPHSDKDLLPAPKTNPSYRRRVISTGLLTLSFLLVITTVVAFRSGSGVFHGGSKVTADTPANIAPATVTIGSAGYSPSTITVKVGQAVVWTNNDVVEHFVSSDDPQPVNPNEPTLSSGQSLGPADSYSYVFNQVGSFGYHDITNPMFKGTVEVKQ